MGVPQTNSIIENSSSTKSTSRAFGLNRCQETATTPSSRTSATRPAALNPHPASALARHDGTATEVHRVPTDTIGTQECSGGIHPEKYRDFQLIFSCTKKWAHIGKIADFGGNETGNFTKKNGDLTQNRYLNGVNMT